MKAITPFEKELVSAIATEIVLILVAYWQDQIERTVHPSQRMETILTFIRENLASPLSRQRLAETFFISGLPQSAFKLEFGMSPSAVINRERVARAYQLIDQEGMSVTQICSGESVFKTHFIFPGFLNRFILYHPLRFLRKNSVPSPLGLIEVYAAARQGQRQNYGLHGHCLVQRSPRILAIMLRRLSG